MKNPDPTRGRDTFKESVLQSPSPAAAGRRRRRRGRRRSVAPAPDRRRRRGRRRWTMVTTVMNGGGTVGNAGTAMRCRKAGSRQGKSGHEGHEEFLVVRVITILFLPLWALQVERETPDNNLTGQKNKFPNLRFHSGRGNRSHAHGIVHELEKIGVLRRIGVVDQQPGDNLPVDGVKAVSRIAAADAASPGDHLPSIPVVAVEFDSTLHKVESLG